ncbi:PH domain-containing protein [Diaminobutyricimonas sp. TR449]|uniref:PH domain-containing protein n=1 Tax=Diaminobutyricimonas sp. TR449 TaxID=2708076 RepID=UPI00141E0A88|nr:PH domain-containing protein [Diaminobutyricimonas sp. TR449]
MSTEPYTAPVAQAPEAVVARLRSHGRALFWPTIALFASAFGTAYFYGQFAEPWQNIAVLAAGLLAVLLLWFVPLLRWLGRNYTITTRRLVLRTGFFVRVRQELLHSRGYDITVRRNGLQLIFRSGHVRINTGLEHPVVLKDVPRADLVQAALHDLMERSQNPIAARRQEEQSRADDATAVWGNR